MKVLVGSGRDTPKRSRGGWLVFLILFLGATGVAALYLLPQSSPTVNELYSAVDTRVFNSLRRFRIDFPPERVDVGGTIWEYVRVGSGPETVVFLHGLLGAGDIWWQQMTSLSRDYRVIAPTIPAVDDMDELLSGVMTILEHEGVDAAHVVGTSIGGLVAQYMLKEHPSAVRTLVLTNAFPPNDEMASRYGAQAAVVRYLPSRTTRRKLFSAVERDVLPASGSSELLRAYQAEQIARIEAATLAAHYRAVTQYFVPPDPTRFQATVVIMESSNDPFVSAGLRSELRGLYADAHVVAMGPVGHFPYLTRPHTYTNDLRDALSGRALAAR